MNGNIVQQEARSLILRSQVKESGERFTYIHVLSNLYTHTQQYPTESSPVTCKGLLPHLTENENTCSQI